jgi:hypothetical protein
VGVTASASVFWACALWFVLGIGTGAGLVGLWRGRPAKPSSGPETPEQALARLAVPPGADRPLAGREAG